MDFGRENPADLRILAANLDLPEGGPSLGLEAARLIENVPRGMQQGVFRAHEA